MDVLVRTGRSFSGLVDWRRVKNTGHAYECDCADCNKCEASFDPFVVKLAYTDYFVQSFIVPKQTSLKTHCLCMLQSIARA